MKVSELVESKFDPNFKLLDGTNPEKPYSVEVIMTAMKQLHARVHRQADNYGGKIDSKTGKIDTSKHKFLPAVISHV